MREAANFPSPGTIASSVGAISRISSLASGPDSAAFGIEPRVLGGPRSPVALLIIFLITFPQSRVNMYQQDFARGSPMSAIVQASRPASPNRRRRVRQKVHAPAYASFSGASKSEMLDLYEVLDISEIGVAVQCPSPMEINQQVDLCLDLAEASGQISASARVVWSDSTGRVGLGFPALTESAARRLREWLFLNAMAAAANAASSAELASSTPQHSAFRPNYTD